MATIDDVDGIKDHVFVLCPPFHGATLVAFLLNNHSRITALGDSLPYRAHPDFWCSCGQQIRDCEFWQTLARTLDIERYPEEEKWIPIVPRIGPDTASNRERLNLLLSAPRFLEALTRLRYQHPINDFVDNLELLHRSACAMNGTDILIDGEKTLLRFKLFQRYSDTSIKVLHLTRDPRGFVNSYRRNVDTSLSVHEIAELWKTYHEAVDTHCRQHCPESFTNIRHEDICAYGDRAFEPFLAMLNLPLQPLSVPPRAPHHIIGNRMLTDFGGRIRLDTRFETDLSVEEQNRILANASPLAQSYGYPESV